MHWLRLKWGWALLGIGVALGMPVMTHAVSLPQDSQQARVYIDIEGDQAPSFIVNQHYRFSFEGQKTLSPDAYLDYRLDTGLFDWDTPMFASERLRYIPEISYVTHFWIPRSTLNFSYGPGELVTFHRQVFAKRNSGVQIQLPVFDSMVNASLWLKPTYTTSSNVKQIRLVSEYELQPNAKFRGGWEYSSDNTGNFFGRSGSFDEKWIVEAEVGSPQGSRLKVAGYLAANGYAYTASLSWLFGGEHFPKLRLSHQAAVGTFLDTALMNYYSDYGLVDPLNEAIENDSAVSAVEVILPADHQTWLVGGYYRTQAGVTPISALRLLWTVAMSANTVYGLELRYSNPASFGQGYRWEGKAFTQIQF
jgi:hypothetical protein